VSERWITALTDSEVASLADQRNRFLAARRNLILAVLTACPGMLTSRAEALADFVLAAADAAPPPPAEALSGLSAYEEVVLDVHRLNLASVKILRWSGCRGAFWFRLFGVGLNFLSYARFPVVFSEREGYRRPLVRGFGWRVFWLPRGFECGTKT